MKYSYMSFSTPTATLREMVDIAREYGYQGIEPRIGADHRHGIELSMSQKQRKEARSTLAAFGMSFACIATSLQFAVSESQQQTFEDGLAAIDLAADLGCGVVRVFGGKYAEDVGREDAIGVCIDGFRRVAPHAAERKVTLAFETHDAWTDPMHVMAVVSEIGVGAVGVNWDIMHPVRVSGYTVEGAYEILASSICHVHVHDGAGPGEKLAIHPMGRGYYDHKTAIELLSADGYAGFISGEWIASVMPEDYGYEKHLPQELAVLKSYEPRAENG